MTQPTQPYCVDVCKDLQELCTGLPETPVQHTVAEFPTTQIKRLVELLKEGDFGFEFRDNFWQAVGNLHRLVFGPKEMHGTLESIDPLVIEVAFRLLKTIAARFGWTLPF